MRVQHQVSPKHPLRRALFISVAGIGVLILALLLILYIQASRTPSWWNPADANSSTTRAIGEHVENVVVSDFTKVRDGADTRWSMDLNAQWINAWLATRLPQWAANRSLPWAATVSQAHVVIDPEEIHVGFACDLWGSARMISVSFHLVFSDGPPPSLQAKDLHFAVGRLTAPAGLVLNRLAEATSDSADDSAVENIAAWLSGRPVEPMVKLADGRRVVVRGLTVGQNQIHLDLETLPAQ